MRAGDLGVQRCAVTSHRSRGFDGNTQRIKWTGCAQLQAGDAFRAYYDTSDSSLKHARRAMGMPQALTRGQWEDEAT